MLGTHLYLLQRISALVMVPLTLGHLAVMIYAVQGGLSSAEILGRTQGSVFWLLFYGLFVIAVSVHASIGLRVVVHETLRIRGLPLTVFSVVVCVVLLTLGMTAVRAVT